MKTTKATEYVLGVMVTNRTVQAVLLQTGSAGAVVLRRFTRHRSLRPASVQPSMAPTFQDVQDDVSGNDFSIQFGDGASGGSELFLGSEFGMEGGPGGGLGSDHGLPAEQPAVSSNTTFMVELSEILEECRELGYEQPPIAFCAAASDVVHVELHAPGKAKRKAKSAAKPEADEAGAQRPDREQLLALLGEQYKGEFMPEKVGFLPMTPGEDGIPRFLAVLAKGDEPVEATLAGLREQRDERMPSVRLLDAEVSLYLGLARAALRWLNRSEEAAPAARNTMVVRAGAEDTLVSFLQGDRLRHHESMRSLTAFDAPETICSRVMLLQDEYGIDEVHHVLLLSEEREEHLLESFRAFFPDAEVRSLRGFLPKTQGGAGGEKYPAPLVPAITAALRLVGEEPWREVFEDVNLLPKRLLRRQVRLPFTWHSLAVAGLILVTVLFFGARYAAFQGDIRDVRETLRQYPPELEHMDARVLQARIDSLQAVHQGYLRALNVLDTLLVGSDKWSRGLEHLSRASAAVTGVWIDSWQPAGGTSVVITGNATSRDRIVHLAERTEGAIEALSFSEIREWPVYSFRMQFPLREELPEAATYLRQLVQVSEAGTRAADGAPAPAPPPVSAAAHQANR